MDITCNSVCVLTSQVLKDALTSLSQYTTPADYVLLPLILIVSMYIYNKGNHLPKRDPLAYKLFERPQDQLHYAGVRKTETRNIAKKIEETNADLVLFWGSQSGVAEGFAHRMAREFTYRFRKGVLVADLSDYDSPTLALIPKHNISIFIMSTFGEGDPSDNALEFVAWTKSKPEESLETLRYAAFGCGNSNYKCYNKVIDDVVEGLGSRGAVALVPTGKGDESARSTEEELLEWKENLCSVLISEYDFTEHNVGYEALVEVIFVSPHIAGGIIDSDAPFVRSMPRQGRSDIVALPVASQKAIAKYTEANRTCVHIELDLTPYRQIKYQTGDHISIWPKNETGEISRLVEVLGLKSKQHNQIRVVSRGDGSDGCKVPELTTPYSLFQHHLEICAPVPRETVLLLVQFAQTEQAREELKAIGQDRKVYAQFLKQRHITLSRLLQYIMETDPLVTCVEVVGI